MRTRMLGASQGGSGSSSSSSDSDLALLEPPLVSKIKKGRKKFGEIFRTSIRNPYSHVKETAKIFSYFGISGKEGGSFGLVLCYFLRSTGPYGTNPDSKIESLQVLN